MAATDQHASDDVGDRTQRAATERMMVALEAPGVWEVFSEPDREGPLTDDSQIVSLVGTDWVCTCKDWEFRQPAGGCKHARRVQLVCNERPLPDIAGVDPLLCERVQEGDDV
jgi:hypothetical protein